MRESEGDGEGEISMVRTFLSISMNNALISFVANFCAIMAVKIRKNIYYFTLTCEKTLVFDYGG